MAVHIQEVLGQYVGPILAQYAQNDLGLDEAQAFKSVEKAIPAVLAGVINHVGDEHAAKRFFNLLTGTNVDTNGWTQACCKAINWRKCKNWAANGWACCLATVAAKSNKPWRKTQVWKTRKPVASWPWPYPPFWRL